VGLKQLGQAARVAQCAVHGAEQRLIAQLESAVNVPKRKNNAAHHHGFRLASWLLSYHLLGFMYKWLAKNHEWFERKIDLAKSKVTEILPK
jgi:hypothetical protein